MAEGRRPSVEEMYSELLNVYSRVTSRPRDLLERDIARRVAQGVSREEAIESLYGELRGGAVGEGLEAALEGLRSRESSLKFFTGLMALIFFALMLAAALSGNPIAAVILWFVLVALVFAVQYAAGHVGSAWEYSEEFVVEGAGANLEDVVRLVPHTFQALTLQDVSPSLEGSRLTLRMRLERVVVDRSSSGASPLNLDLGSFTITAEFSRRDGDLLVRASYRGEPPAARSSVAAAAYEGVIVAFRSAVREAWERVRPKVVLTVDFAEVARLLASTGLVVTAVRCPYCGGSIELPKDGDTTRCPYCGSVVKAIDVYKLLREVLALAAGPSGAPQRQD